MKTRNFLTRSLVALTFISFALVSCEKEADNISNDEAKTSEEFDINSVTLSCKLMSKAEFEKLPVAPEELGSSLKALPSKYNLQCPPIRSQGREGSCTAWGTAYAARSIMYHHVTGGGYSNSTNIFSPEYVYNQIKLYGCGSGSYTWKALNLLREQGVSTWEYMPYTSGDCDTYPNATQKENAAKYKISNWWRLRVEASMFKRYLAAGYPIVVGGPITREFARHRKGEIITTFDPHHGGGHAYCVVGYDDSIKAFKVMNSWGTRWGTNGYGWISYDIMSRYWSEAFIMAN